MFKQVALIYLLGLAVVLGCKNSQVHIALSDYYTTLKPSDPMLKIIFHTESLCPGNYVRLNLGNGSSINIPTTATSFNVKYPDGMYQTYVHNASVTGIKFDTYYNYKIYNSNTTVFDGPFRFKVPNPNPTSLKRSFIFYGDYDTSVNGQLTLSYLKKIANPVDLFVHFGDLAYNLENDKGTRGDKFMNDIQDIAANVPYMVSPGNHEQYKNFTNFNMRFVMPQYNFSQNHLYSFNVDNVHFVSLGLELPATQPELVKNTLNWLEQDLKAAQANRAQRPWIIVWSHRPLYCSSDSSGTNCGLTPTLVTAFEKVLYKYGVDLHLSGHIHTYERNFPIYKGKKMPFTNPVPSDKNNRYIQDPQAPIYIVEGTPGFIHNTAVQKTYKGNDFCAYGDRDYSVGKISVANNTHLLWEMIHTRNGNVSDSFWLIKTKNSYSSTSSFSALLENEQAAMTLSEIPSEYPNTQVYLSCLAAVGLLAFVYFKRSKRACQVKGKNEDNEVGASIIINSRK